MSFTLPDLVIEGAIRKGYDLMRSPTRDAIIDVVFNFSEAVNNTDGGLPSSVYQKYSSERERLIDFFADDNNEVAIVHSFSDVQAHLPCISIQLQADGEDQGLALADDFGGTAGVFGDNDRAGYREAPDLNIIHANTVINVGIHTKEQLLTKYLYHLTKYFVLSAKLDLIRQNFIVATFRGSDFSRDAAWQGDHVYTRFINISGKTEDSWTNLDEIVALIDQVNVNTYVPTAENGTIFSNPASEVNMTLVAGATTIQVANSFYLGTGAMTLLTRDNSGNVLAQEVINVLTNDTITNILTTTATTLEHLVNPDLVNPENRITTFVIQGIDITESQTVQSRPAELTTASKTVSNNDADGVIHRSNTSGNVT